MHYMRVHVHTLMHPSYLHINTYSTVVRQTAYMYGNQNQCNKTRTVCVCICVCVYLYVCVYAYAYPSSALSFGQIGIKLGMDTPLDPAAGLA